MSQHQLQELLAERILVLDGAMGTTIRGYGLDETAARGERFVKNRRTCSTTATSSRSPARRDRRHPQALLRGRLGHRRDQHLLRHHDRAERVLRRGPARNGRAEGSRSSSNGKSWRSLPRDLAREINVSRPNCAACEADKMAGDSGKPRYVAGAIGPLTVSLTNSPDADDPGFRVVTFDQVAEAYRHQVRALIEGGGDILMVETIFDSLNAKAALVAIREVFDDRRRRPADHRLRRRRPRRRNHDLRPESRGPLECDRPRQAARGRTQLLARPRPDAPASRGARRSGRTLVSATRTPACPTRSRRPASTSCRRTWSTCLDDFAAAGLVNLVGGCCGNTPEHIAAIAKAVERHPPREIPPIEPLLRLTGSEAYNHTPDKNFLMIGERTNVAGSPRFAQTGPGRKTRGRPRRRPPAGRERRQRHRHLLRRRHDRRRRDDDPLPPPPGQPNRTSPRCPSWSIPRSGRSSRPA